MTYLRNAWYAAGWGAGFADTPVARTIHDQPIAFYRTEDGDLKALADACPHRFAPLSRGRVEGTSIVCGYHGLTFDGTGRCVRNPHGKGVIPVALAVQAFPVIERDGLAWIWMGDAERADASLLPRLPVLADPSFAWCYGQLHVATNFQFVTDNLLDLSHVEFMHPFLAKPGSAARTTFRAEQNEGRVSAYWDQHEEPVSGLVQLLWTHPEMIGDARVHMHWSAPCNLYLDVGHVPLGKPRAEGVEIPSVHLLTPETADTTHYFWAAGRNRKQEDAMVTQMMQAGIQNAFKTEDEPMICAARGRMRSNDLFAHKPVLLPTDEAAVRARRMLNRLISEELGSAVAT